MNSHTYQALTRSARLALRSTVIVLVLLSSLLVQSTDPREMVRADEGSSHTPSGLTLDYSSLPLSFIPNVGQLDPHIQYYVHGMGSELLFAPDEVTLNVPSSTEEDATQTVRLSFVGADQNPVISTTGTLPGIVNYLYGNDPEQWLTNVPTYAGLMYEQLYPGISLTYDGTQGMLKGTYLVLPGADTDVIRWQYAGVAGVQVDPATQDLRLYLSEAAESVYLTELAPLAWQEIGGAQVPVEARYTVFDDQTIGFTLGSYDPNQALYVDPSIQYANYLGGAADESGSGIAVDSTANIYITGTTASENFPTEAPLYNRPVSDVFPNDAYVTKISMSSSQLVFSTYLGGTGTDNGHDITVDASGNVYVTGHTLSPDFPVTFGTYHLGGDAFVTKLNTNGTALLYSTFLGGTESDLGTGIAVDASGNAYITGETSSTDFPISNAIPGHDTYGGGTTDAFVTKLNADGTAALFSTFLGGADVDRGRAIAVDSTHVYVTGATLSPTGFSGTYSGSGDAFVARFTATGTPALAYEVYLGGAGDDDPTDIAVRGGLAYVTGATQSDDFPYVYGLPGGTYKGGRDAFVTGYTSVGGLLFSTLLGGSLDDKGFGIGVDSSGNIYVAGQTQSSDFPNVNGFQPGLNGLQDAFLTKILVASSSVEYSSYIGGSGIDLAYDLAVSSDGSAYLTGNTNSDDFPIPINQTDKRQRGGGSDAFVVRVGAKQANVGVSNIADIPTVTVGQNLPITLTVINYGTDPTTVTMTDELSTSVTYVSHTTTHGTCVNDAPTHTFNCAFGVIAVNDVVTIHLIVNVTSMPIGGNVVTTATVAGTEFDPDGDNNVYSQSTHVGFQANLEVIKLADSYRVRQNEYVTFFISIHNLGPGSASAIDLTDILPPEVTYVSHVQPAGSLYVPGTGLWTVDSILVGATTTLTITGRVGTYPVGTLITNTANNLHANAYDPQTDNNSSTISMRVVAANPESGCHPSPTNPNEVICLTH